MVHWKGRGKQEPSLDLLHANMIFVDRGLDYAKCHLIPGANVLDIEKIAFLFLCCKAVEIVSPSIYLKSI